MAQVLFPEDQMLPRFRATVDASLFTSPTSTINVSVNPVTHKVLVEAATDPSEGPIRTLTQSITLPRFADENCVEHTLKSDGILQVTACLVDYYYDIIFFNRTQHTYTLCPGLPR